MVGAERVYQSDHHLYVGYDQGRQMVAELIKPDSRQPSVPTFGTSPPEPPGESSGSRGAPEQSTPERANVAEGRCLEVAGSLSEGT
eukprot:481641-Amphidinium_carterae.1